MPKISRKLKIALQGLDPPIPILNFDNQSGALATENVASGYHEGTILTDDGNLVWKGIVKIQEHGKFDLCISPNASTAVDETIPWKDLPPFFTVFDGGYEPLGQENVTTLLDDLISFHDLVKVRCHFESNEKQQSISATWGDQENLKTLSEVLIDWSFAEKLESQQIVLLELELFETVYFVIGLCEESDNLGVVLSLTAHFYQQRNRVGRRIPIDPVEIDGYKILEVNDFGMKATTIPSNINEQNEIQIHINGYKLLFGITYHRNTSNEEVQVGLCVQDHSPEARKAWQGFLLKYQYHSLSYRTPKQYLDIWNLYREAGYLKDEVEVIGHAFRDAIGNEWEYVDKIGPTKGAAVVGHYEGKAVATIGVSKAFGGLWAAQSAAVIDRPEHLCFTREMYSWRTRFIIQQVDSEYHLAFFLKNKPFLDRFFRKFYLLRTESKRKEIIWEEWKYYSVVRFSDSEKKRYVSNAENKSPDIQAGNLETSKFIELLNRNLENDAIGKRLPSAYILNARPFIHIAQYFNAAFISGNCDLAEIQEVFAHLPAYTIFSSEPLSESNLAVLDKTNNKLFGGHEEVTWACPKSQLPEFLQNSLKSLEIMMRKYYLKSAA